MPNTRGSRNRSGPVDTNCPARANNGAGYGSVLILPDMIVPDSANGPTAAVTGTASQSQYDTLAFDVTAANANDEANINIDVPNDYEGDAALELHWQVNDNTTTNLTDWRHTWRRTPPDGTAVLDAAGTAGTAVRTAMPATANYVQKSTLTPPGAVLNALLPGDHLLIHFEHDNDSATQPANNILLIKAVFTYRRG